MARAAAAVPEKGGGHTLADHGVDPPRVLFSRCAAVRDDTRAPLQAAVHAVDTIVEVCF